MMKDYKITYCNEQPIIDLVKARNPREAIRKICNPIYFRAVQVSTKEAEAIRKKISKEVTGAD